MDNIHRILCGSNNSSATIKSLYDYHKGVNPKFSIGYLCSKAGIPSRGYLHDVMKGARHLSPKYGRGLAKAFSLSKPATKYFVLLVEVETERNLEKRAELIRNLDLQKKILSSVSNYTLASDVDHLFCFKVFASFGLFKNNPSEVQIKKHFGATMALKVSGALLFLESEGLIKRQNGKFILTHQSYAFGTKNSWLSAYLKDSLGQAQLSIDTCLGSPEKSLVSSSFISVNRSQYFAALKKFREYIEEFQAEIESDNADDIIQFSVQLFPIALK